MCCYSSKLVKDVLQWIAEKTGDQARWKWKKPNEVYMTSVLLYYSVDGDEVLRHKPEEDLATRRDKTVVCKQEMALSVCERQWPKAQFFSRIGLARWSISKFGSSDLPRPSSTMMANTMEAKLLSSFTYGPKHQQCQWGLQSQPARLSSTVSDDSIIVWVGLKCQVKSVLLTRFLKGFQRRGAGQP